MTPNESISGVVERVQESIRIEKENDVQEVARLLDAPFLTSVLRRSLPLDLCNPSKIIFFQDLIVPVDRPVDQKRLYERVWHQLCKTQVSGEQDQSLIVLTGVSGVGKTKVAFDIGINCAIVIVARVWEAGVFTRPFGRFMFLAENLKSQCCEGGCTLETARQLTLELLQHLLLSHLEWVLDVLEEFARQQPIKPSDEDLRHVAIRCQRNGLANRAVCFRFERAIGQDPLGIATSASDRMHALDTRSKQLLGPNAFIVWCHDEAQTLFMEVPDVHELFQHDSPVEWYKSTQTLRNELKKGVQTETQAPKLFPNADDTAPNNSSSTNYGVLRSYLGVLRLWMTEGRNFAHILTGTSLHLAEDMIHRQSPARGVTQVIHVDTKLDEHDIKALYSEYLTPEALGQLPPEYFQRVRGRPLYSVHFWSSLAVHCGTRNCSLDCVHKAAKDGLFRAASAAEARTHVLWRSNFCTSQGLRPHQLVAALYYLMRLGYGAQSQITKWSEEVFEAIRRGVFNVSFKDRILDLDEEPITKQAILDCGDSELKDARSDDILRAIQDRWLGPFGYCAAKGGVFEDMLIWQVFSQCVKARDGSLPLSQLLRALGLSPAFILPELGEYRVQISAGLSCSDASTCFLDAFCEKDPDGVLEEKQSEQKSMPDKKPDQLLAQQILHHLPHDTAGADVAFLVRRLNDVGEIEWRLVIVQLNNRQNAKLPDAIRSLDMGKWFPDQSNRSTKLKQETSSHRVFRENIVKYKTWACDPIRVVVHNLPFAERLQNEVAYLNHQFYKRQPLLLVHPTWHDFLGAQSVTRRTMATRVQSSESYRITKIRHWEDQPHPQAYLDTINLPELHRFTVVSRRVRVKRQLLRRVGREDLLEQAIKFGSCRSIRDILRGIVVEYDNIYNAMEAEKAEVPTITFSFDV